GREGFLCRLDKLAVLVLQLGPRQVVLLGIGVLDVADGGAKLANIGCNTFVALAALASGPLDRLAFAHGVFPLRRNLGQVVGPAESRARTVGTVNNDDVGVGQVQVGVHFFDGGIVPLLDLGQEDVGQNRAGKLQGAGLDAFDVDDGHRAAHDGGELEQVVLFEVFGLDR